MQIWIVWEVVDDWPESGGGEYLDEIFLHEADAIAYCEKQNTDPEKEFTSVFEVRPFTIK